MKHISAWLALAVFVAGCAQVSSIQLGNDMVRVVVDAAPACGRSGAQEVAFKQAAVATIKNGLDRFLIVGDQTIATSKGSSIVFGTAFKHTAHSQEFVIKMFGNADEKAENAIIARNVLGSEWGEIVKAGGPTTC